MGPGEEFEIDSFNYIKKKYENKHITFQRTGGMDSTVSDIAVINHGQIKFFIEAKMGSAQSGQFVILPDNEKNQFYFSPRNKSKEDFFSRLILYYINDNFKTFLQAGTSGENIDIDNSVFAKWIINHYKSKGVKYLITYNNGFIIFPIEKFEFYFNISAMARNKGSGSREPAKKNWNEVSSYITTEYDVTDTTPLKDGKKNRLLAYTLKLVDKESFQIEKLTYQFSTRQPEAEYEIRKLNRITKNTTVIFSIKIKSSQIKDDLEQFENELMNN